MADQISNASEQTTSSDQKRTMDTTLFLEKCKYFDLDVLSLEQIISKHQLNQKKANRCINDGVVVIAGNLGSEGESSQEVKNAAMIINELSQVNNINPDHLVIKLDQYTPAMYKHTVKFGDYSGSAQTATKKSAKIQACENLLQILPTCFHKRTLKLN